MERQALAVLEYPLIVERVADAAVTPHGVELARDLLPSPDVDEVTARQARTAEAVALIEGGTAPSLGGVADVRSATSRAERGRSLEPGELRAIASTVAAALAARGALA